MKPTALNFLIFESLPDIASCSQVLQPSLSRSVAEVWCRYLQLWHNHKIIGLDNIPSTGPGLTR